MKFEKGTLGLTAVGVVLALVVGFGAVAPARASQARGQTSQASQVAMEQHLSTLFEGVREELRTNEELRHTLEELSPHIGGLGESMDRENQQAIAEIIETAISQIFANHPLDARTRHALVTQGTAEFEVMRRILAPETYSDYGSQRIPLLTFDRNGNWAMQLFGVTRTEISRPQGTTTSPARRTARITFQVALDVGAMEIGQGGTAEYQSQISGETLRRMTQGVNGQAVVPVPIVDGVYVGMDIRF